MNKTKFGELFKKAMGPGDKDGHLIEYATVFFKYFIVIVCVVQVMHLLYTIRMVMVQLILVNLLLLWVKWERRIWIVHSNLLSQRKFSLKSLITIKRP
jgi:hypothetical protein